MELLYKYSGTGPHLFIDGVKYFDCSSGTFNLSLGYDCKPVVDAVQKQIGQCAHLSSEHTYPISKKIFEKLQKHLPDYMDDFWFRDITGSSANECAIRIAQKATGKNEMVSLFLSHHGQTLSTAEISGNAFRTSNFNAAHNGIKIPAPDCNNCFYSQSKGSCNTLCASRLNEFIQYASNGSVAALIIEPVMGNGGNIIPPTDYFRKIRKICTEHNILIIADEVQTGFGRTGTFFASTGYAKELFPDIITFAKGAGGIGIPVAGVLMRKELNVLESWEHSFTSGANPLSLVAIDKTIDYLEKNNIVDNVKTRSINLERDLKLIEQQYSDVSNVRGLGLMFAFDLPDAAQASAFIQEAKNKGLLVRQSRYGFGRTVKVRPPLIINKSHIVEIISKIRSTLDVMAGECISEIA